MTDWANYNLFWVGAAAGASWFIVRRDNVVISLNCMQLLATVAMKRVTFSIHSNLNT